MFQSRTIETAEASDYLDFVNEKISQKMHKEIKNLIIRCKPLGNNLWTKTILKKHALEYTINQKGRPKKD